MRHLMLLLWTLVLGSCGTAFDDEVVVFHTIESDGPVRAQGWWSADDRSLWARLVLRPVADDTTRVNWGQCSLRFRAYEDPERTRLIWTDERIPRNGVTLECTDIGLEARATRSEPAIIRGGAGVSELEQGLPDPRGFMVLWIELNEELVGVPAEYVPPSEMWPKGQAN